MRRSGLLVLALALLSACREHDRPVLVLPWDIPHESPVVYACGREAPCTLDDFMARNRVCVLLVVQAGVPRLAKVADADGQCLDRDAGLDENAIDRPYGLASISKSITATLFGFANAALPADRRFDLERPVVDYLEGLTAPGFERVTPADVLTMSSGLEWDEPGDEGELRDDAIDRADLPDSATLMQAVNGIVARHAKRPPGSFSYSAVDSALVALLADELLRRLGDPAAATLPDALAQWIWRPGGMQDRLRWKTDRVGVPAGWCCSYATPRDLGRLGSFLLRAWHGELGAERQAWMQAAGELRREDVGSCSSPAGNWTLGYGYQWWVFQAADGAPIVEPNFTALGRGGQFLHLLPRRDLVIVQLSDWDDRRGAWSEERACESYAVHAALAAHFGRP